MSSIEHHLYIGGGPVEATSGETFESINPATGEVISRVQQAAPADVDRAVEAAREGQRRWAKLRGVERARVLLRAVALLRERNDELARLETLDTGKPLSETSTVDITTGADAIEYYAGLAPAVQGEQIPLTPTAFAYTRREPLGVCAGIGAWNYPLQIACWKSAPALACGNAMVFKPSEVTPLSALKLAEIFTEAGLPDGVFNVVQGDGRVGALLTTHEGIDKVSFTGEVGTGKKVAEAAARSNLKEVTVELGGKSPLIVFEDADLEQAVAAALMANFYSSGQVCTNGTRVFVYQRIQDAFERRLVERVRRIRIGDPFDPETNFGPLVSFSHLEKVLRYLEIGKAEGARLLIGGERPSDGPLARGAYVAPTIFSDCTDEMTIVREEIFGPVMAILPFSDENEVIRRANATPYGLAAGVFSESLRRAHRVIHQLQAGICWINSYNLSPVEMPVGGYKQSGIGRENGVVTLNHYTQIKSVYVETGDVETPFE